MVRKKSKKTSASKRICVRRDPPPQEPIFPEGLAGTQGSSTGETLHSTVSGGWAGTDDDVSSTPMVEVPAEKTLAEVEEKARIEDEKNWDARVESEELEELEEQRE